jgi:hypothetical protein
LAEHWLLAVQAWQVEETQIGAVGLVQWEEAEHCTQAPPVHTGRPWAVTHSGPDWQARQVPDEQMGVVAGQSVWPMHWTQAPAPPQNLLVEEAAAHSVLLAHARHRPVEVLQKGVFPEHCPLPVQVTHDPLVAPAVEQSG